VGSLPSIFADPFSRWGPGQSRPAPLSHSTHTNTSRPSGTGRTRHNIKWYLPEMMRSMSLLTDEERHNYEKTLSVLWKQYESPHTDPIWREKAMNNILAFGKMVKSKLEEPGRARAAWWRRNNGTMAPKSLDGMTSPTHESGRSSLPPTNDNGCQALRNMAARLGAPDD